MEHVELTCSLESKLFFIPIFSIAARSRKGNIFTSSYLCSGVEHFAIFGKLVLAITSRALRILMKHKEIKTRL